MSVADAQDLKTYCHEVAARAKSASVELAVLSGTAKNCWLIESAKQLRQRKTALIKANEQDLVAAPSYGLTEAQIDRLKLTTGRIDDIAVALEDIAALADPVGEMIESSVRPNGLDVSKVRVPLGVVFFIYESRPNVTADAAAICVKSGNAVILRGGKEAMHSSRAIVTILREIGAECGLPTDAVQLVHTTDRDAVGYFLSLADQIDVAIPRGGEGLIRRVAAEATMPVIKHFTGNCHVYVDGTADLAMTLPIVVNSKCQRLGVCNACESLLVHADVASEYLPKISTALMEQGIEVRGDAKTCELVAEAKAVDEHDYGQ